MKATLARYAGRGLAVGIAIGALHFAAPAWAFSTGSYDLFNHPDGALTQASGAQNQVVYGLRSDAFCNTIYASCGTVSDRERTFTVENEVNGSGDVVYAHNTSAVSLTWNTTSATISGTILWNDDNPNPSTSDVWTISYDLTGLQALDGSDLTNGWYSASATGTMTRVSDGAVIYMNGNTMHDSEYNVDAAFIFAPDGHRCDTTTGGAANYGNFPDGSGGSSSLTSMCDPTVDTELVGRGWFTLTYQYYDSYWCKWKWATVSNGSNDFLVVAKNQNPPPPPPPPPGVPEPSMFMLFGFGLVGLRMTRRQRARAKT